MATSTKTATGLKRNHNRMIGEARLEEFRLLVTEGLSDSQMAERTGLSESRVRYFRRKAGVKLVSGSVQPTTEQIALIGDLVGDGWPTREISSHLGFHPQTILKYSDRQQARINGNAWAGVQRWAGVRHAELFREIKREGT